MRPPRPRAPPVDGVGRQEAPTAGRVRLHWLDLSVMGYPRSVALSSLPGGATAGLGPAADGVPPRRLDADLDWLAGRGFSAVLLLCTDTELAKCGAQQLVDGYESRGVQVTQLPVLEGGAPELPDLLELFGRTAELLELGGQLLIQCSTGLGRTCTAAACLLLHTNPSLTAEQAVETVRQLCGPRAVQSVRQFNFIQDFREARDEYLLEMALPASRPPSR